MWRTISLLILITVINGQCHCNRFTDQQSCIAYGYCLFVNGVCAEQKCEAIPYQEKCKSPLCLWKENKCLTFKAAESTCEALLPQQCNEYNGCYYDYTNLKCKISNNCSKLQIDECNGKLKNGNSCIVDPFNNKCQEMTDCKSLSTEFMCLSQYPFCLYQNSSCQPSSCLDIIDSTSCSIIDECQWRNNQCQFKNCQSILLGEKCNGKTCGFNKNKCFSCVEQYGYQFFVGLISLLFIL